MADHSLTSGAPLSLGYAGVARTVEITEPGDLLVDLWGGGGGGGWSHSESRLPGGGAGWTQVKTPVVAGDVVTVEVGQGGAPALAGATVQAGGWPDGGLGGHYSGYAGGGGGGSTRLYLNGSLIAVAGGGGGGMTRAGGAGGGATGGASPGGVATGGTQTAGGTGANALVPAGALRGGDSPNTNFASAGGGGGWFGGGAGGGNYGGGGGGSGYGSPAVTVQTTAAATASTPNVSAPAAGSPPSASVGAGGRGGTITAANISKGGDGLAVLSLAVKVAPTPTYLTLDAKVVETYTGEPATHIVTAAGVLSVKMWGAGGAGGLYNSSGVRYGGSGGFTKVAIPVQPGDIVKVEVGQGGRQPASNAEGGPGGWPDGGDGGYASTTYCGGGGGGSTRVWINDVLMAVAGAGGGGGASTGSGSGGGFYGENGAGASMGTGAGQNSGGVCVLRPADPTSSGAYLKGGHGYINGATRFTASTTYCGGGGGGYYGGGGGGSNGGAGGGSSYVHFSCDGATEQWLNLRSNGQPSGGASTSGSNGVPNTADPDYVAGVARGGLTTNNVATATPGGDGLAVLSLATTTEVAPVRTFLHRGAVNQTWTAAKPGKITVRMWGGGSGGSKSLGAAQPGGAGGMVGFSRTVQPGDTFSFQVAQGGRSVTASGGGLGGWPDGGSGGLATATSGWGGGGGSTRCYFNSSLYAVAGGGGAGGNGASGTTGGSAGGATGRDGAPMNNGNYSPGYGGTQTAGGVNKNYTTDASYAGGYLKGGNGFPVGASNASIGEGIGPGGGGGYYGGAGGCDTLSGAVTLAGGAGGGSSFAPPDGTNYGTNSAAPPGSDLAEYVPGVAATGTNTTGYEPWIGDGGHGAVWIYFEPEPEPFEEETAALPAGVSSLGFSGKRQVRTITSTGLLVADLWGGGGAGAVSSSPKKGGDGAYLHFELPVAPGDEIAVEVAQGGQPFSNASGGPGGWPDGGDGARASGTIGWGGGGGSTRLYKNGVLVAVAGGGGAGSGGNSASTDGGAGGGGNGGPTNNGNYYYGTGGTQDAGGVNSGYQDGSIYAGGYLRGGDGFPTDASRFFTGTNGLGVQSGAGGGGGYYGGGAGSGRTANHSGGGGGGSNLVPAGGTATVGLGGTTVVGYAPGTSVGAPGVASAPVPGGDGLALLNLRVPETLVDGKTTLAAEKVPRLFEATSDGLLSVKTWGGGGSGAVRATVSTLSYGGGGGAAVAQFLLKAGDQVRIEVASGGGAPGPTGLVSGLGGWPDGGRGGRYQTNGADIAGSGGGSTRVWINGVLQLVAAGGGGGNYWYSAAASGDGGAGGGWIGSSGKGQANYVGSAGRDNTGGYNQLRRTDLTLAGGYLSGGQGWLAGNNAESPSTTNAGPGGGGGYYGGAGGAGLASTSSGGAGGGSGYGGPLALNHRLYAGAGRNPPLMDDPDYVAGVGVGAAYALKANALPGGDGRAVLTFEQGASLAPLSEGTHVLTAAGHGPYDFVTDFEGGVALKLWGGAGGGSIPYSTVVGLDAYGGPGGFTSGTLMFNAGDRIRIEVGQGGRAASLNTGGLGGWPDGGSGATGSASSGGGGGSTRVWRNGVLIAVAGGGGGPGGYDARFGGFGGGLTGGSGAGASNGWGGSQTAGGNGHLQRQGAYLRGADGFVAGFDENVANGAAHGAGGGGGYYGGGGAGGNNGSVSSGAGGGSAYMDDLLLEAITQTSETQAAPQSEDPAYIAGVAVGGLNNNASPGPAHGGDGLAVLEVFEGGLSIPAEVDVPEIGTVLINASDGSAVGAKGASAVGALPVLTIVPPVGVVSIPADAAGDLGPSITFDRPAATAAGGIGALFPTIYVTGDLGGQPQTDAVVVTGVADDIPYPLAPAVGIEAAVAHKVGNLGTVDITAIRFIFGNGYDFYDPIVFNVSPPEGEMSVADMWVGEVDSILTVSAPDGAANGDSAVSVPGGQADYIRVISVTPLLGNMRGPDETLVVDLGPAIQVSTPLGAGELPVLYTTAPYDKAIEVTAPDGQGAGGAHFVLQVGNQGGPFATIRVTPPAPFVQVEGSVSRDLGLILIGTPQAAFVRNASVRVNYFDRIYLNPPSGFAAELTAAVVDGDLSDSVIFVSPPEAAGGGGFAYEARLPAVYLRPVEGYVEDNAGIRIPGDNGNRIRFKRALAAGSVPSALEPLEIALNEHDGLLFAADSEGVIQANALGRFARGGVAPLGGQPGDILYADGSWRAPQPEFTRPILLSAPQRAYLCARSLGASVSTPTAGKVVYQPFFVPRQTHFSRLGVSVDQVTTGSMRLGVCRWDIAAQQPTTTVLSNAVGLGGVTGDKFVNVDLTLEPGWYASMICVPSPSPTLRTRRVPTGLTTALTLIGDLSSTDTGDLSTPPQPTGREPQAHAYVWAQR